MAVTIANVQRNVNGIWRETSFDVTGPASYTTGGEALTAAQINQIMPEYAGRLAATDSDKAYMFVSDTNLSDQHIVLDKVNDKAMYFTNAGQVGAATNLSAVTIPCLIRYKA